MALDILHDNWGPYTHTEVENALKAYLSVLEGRINQAIQEGGVGLTDLSLEVQALLTKANTALQPENIAAWAKAPSKPGYTADEITGVEGFQNLLAKLQDMDQKIQAAAQSGSDITQQDIDDAVAAAVAALVDSAPGTLDTLKELATALGNDANFAATIAAQLATKISGIKANGASETLPVDENGIVTLPPAGSTISPATVAPSMDGNTANVGSSAKYAREDHVHPHDSTKANVNDVYSKTDADALLAGKQSKLTFDDAPGNTDNPVKSRGIKQAIDEKLSQVTVNAIPAGSVAVEDNLASTSKTNALSANMGAELYGLIQILFQQLNMVEVSENGLYFIDSNGNIGVCIDSDGLHAINILEHVITE